MFTLIDQEGGAREVAARVEDGRVLLAAEALREALGWELHEGTLCNDAMCVPLPPGSRLGEGGVFDVADVATTLDRPLAVDVDARAAFLGVSAGDSRLSEDVTPRRFSSSSMRCRYSSVMKLRVDLPYLSSPSSSLSWLSESS